MKKDVIYIDADDDITSVVSKIKASTEKIVALVPPVRAGVLQSSVNLRLLAKVSRDENKHMVIVTGSQSLSQLAALAKIPVALNLQSKPKIATIPLLGIDGGDDTIEGEMLAVGDHSQQSQGDSGQSSDKLVDGISLDEPAEASPRQKKDKSAKVPNFSNFRKRFVIVIIGAIVLVGGLIWAFVFAPAARIAITAKTVSVDINDVLSLADQTNVEKGQIKSVEQTIKKDLKLEFSATGEKNIGDKAQGTVSLTQDSASGTYIPEGTELISSSGKVFLTTSEVTVPRSQAFNEPGCNGFPTCPGVASVGIAAAEPGESSNGAVGALSGAPSGVSASLSNATSGGTTKVVSVVTASDIQKAKAELVKQSNDGVKQELVAKFSDSIHLIQDSFTKSYGDSSVDPEVGKEAKGGKAELSVATTFSMTGISGAELSAYLSETAKQQMTDQSTQKIYDDGAKNAKLTEFSRQGANASVRIDAVSQIGPMIDQDDIKERVAGKRFGEIRTDLLSIDGVNDVEIHFSYFWVRTVPKNPDRVTIVFDVVSKND